MTDQLHPVKEAMKQGYHEAARDLLSNYLKVEPNNPEAWLLAAHLVDEPAKKRQALERAQSLAPGHPQIEAALAKLTPAAPPPPPPQLPKTKSSLPKVQARPPTPQAATEPLALTEPLPAKEQKTAGWSFLFIFFLFIVGGIAIAVSGVIWHDYPSRFRSIWGIGMFVIGSIGLVGIVALWGVFGLPTWQLRSGITFEQPSYPLVKRLRESCGELQQRVSQIKGLKGRQTWFNIVYFGSYLLLVFTVVVGVMDIFETSDGLLFAGPGLLMIGFFTFFFAIWGYFFIFSVIRLIVFAIGKLLIPPMRRSMTSADWGAALKGQVETATVGDARLNGVEQVIDKFKDDIHHKRKVRGTLDLSTIQQEKKVHKTKKSPSGWPKTYYKDRWLDARGKLYDGNQLRLAMVDRFKIKKARRTSPSSWRYQARVALRFAPSELQIRPDHVQQIKQSFPTGHTGPVPRTALRITRTDQQPDRLTVVAESNKRISAEEMAYLVRHVYLAPLKGLSISK